jgi:hypothetical protein
MMCVARDKCGSSGRYRLLGLIQVRGRDGKIIDWGNAIAAACPKKSAHNMNDQCGARCPDLPKVLQSQQA